MSIRVGKKWEKGAVYIGRGSVLGNRFVMKTEADRDDVCDKYKEWFDASVKSKNVVFMLELDKLLEIAKKGDLILGCFCSPKRCHGETIKEYLDAKLGQDK